MNNLAHMYDHGKGVERNLLRSKELYQEAIDLANTYAMCNLAYMYEHEKGFERNYLKRILREGAKCTQETHI